MPLSIGVNLRVTGHCNQGGRKYMEDMFSVAYHLTPDDKDLEYAFFGIFDGHGGGEAATFAKEYLMDIIVKQKNFWSDRDEDVLRAIRDGFVNTHYAMWRELDKWPRTASGLPSTAGTTASIAFIRKGKMYIGHVGDSGIILGHQVEGDPQWKAKPLTKDHKPESGPEMIRIQESGGKVVSKSGVPRVVWNRPRIGHKGPVRRSTHIDEIPFLAVARSLGDLWSYNSELDTFVVSPEPDVKVVAIDVKSHRCLIFGTDGLWNMLTPQAAVGIVQTADRHNEKHLIASQQTGNGQTDGQMWINPSKSLVDRALERWSSTRLRADNTSVVTVMLDPPGPSRSEVLLSQKKDRVLSPKGTIHHGIPTNVSRNTTEPIENLSTEKVAPSIPTNCMLTPKSEYANPDTVQPKPGPDSSNEIDEVANDVHFMEIDSKQSSVSIEKSAVIKSEANPRIGDVTCESITEDSSLCESIQVAEVSSSEISDDIGDVKYGKSDNCVNKSAEDSDNVEGLKMKETEDTCVVQDDDNQKGAGVRIFVRQASKAKSDFQIERTTDLDANTHTNMVASRESFEILNTTCHVSKNKFSQLAESEEPKRLIQISDRLKRAGNISTNNSVRTTDAFNGTELRNASLNGSRHKRHSPYVSSREEIESTRRKHSLNGPQHALINIGASNSNYTSMSSRLKLRSTKISLNGTEESLKNSVSTTNGIGVGTKRRHSAIHQTVLSVGIDEPRAKRRTRSEDRRNPTDENDPANQTTEPPNGRLSWPGNETSASRSTANGGTTTTSTTTATISIQERLSTAVPSAFQRKNLGKKATPIKTIRRSSINGTSRLQQLRGTFGLRDWDQARNDRSSSCNERRISRTVNAIMSVADGTAVPQRWLRSDTMAATPVKTLRSRNVDIAGHTISAQLVHQYGVVKPNRLSLPSKMKQSSNGGSLQSNRHRSSSLSSGKLKQTVGSDTTTSTGSCSTIGATNTTGSNTTSGMAKRVKSPYNPSARSLSTRSRIKRLGK